MGGIFGSIINFIASPIGWIVIVGLAGAVGRLANWIGQERAKRAAIQARAQRESEALRTGRPSVVARPGASASQASSEPSEQDRQRALQEQRTAQLRALQQKRLAELRAKRAAGQGGVAAPPPRPTPPAPGRASPAPKARPSPSPVNRSVNRPADRSRQTSERPIQPQQAPRSERFVPKQTPIALDRAPALAQPFRPITPPPTARPVDATEIGGPASRPVGEPAPIVAPVGIGTLAALRHDIKRAVMITEVLGPPVCDRDPDKLGAF